MFNCLWTLRHFCSNEFDIKFILNAYRILYNENALIVILIKQIIASF